MTVKEVSRRCGVSVRTLHYYEEIGLLLRSGATQAGYRLYDDTALERLSQVLLLRELDFPLAQIKTILDNPAFDREEALNGQIRLLEMRRDRLDRLIRLAASIKEKGVTAMDFQAFDTAEIDKYQEEVRKRWGASPAYQEYAEKTKAYSPQDFQNAQTCVAEQFRAFAALRGRDYREKAVQEQVEKLRQAITGNFYTCTVEILSSLGQMYTADDRFRSNIDRYGAGTADFAGRAIAYYCAEKENN